VTVGRSSHKEATVMSYFMKRMVPCSILGLVLAAAVVLVAAIANRGLMVSAL